ncbi:MAG: agmatine deiminase family protein [Candidatus Marinimicrobia bacterium]|nr:agmatine deiminase family protein [Candidatus Neomarinimicrobiota bacterium]
MSIKKLFNNSFILFLFIIPVFLFGETSQIDDLVQKTEKWFKKHPDSYPHWLTPEEASSGNTNTREFYETDPPDGPIYNISEFAPMEGVLIRYPFGISYTVIAEMAEDILVTTIVSSTGQQNYVTNQYNSNGVNLNNCNFLIAPSNSYWTRDYGPWYIIDGNNELAIINFPYNRPRPLDNDIPIEMADFLGLELYGMNVITAGGNYMTDGMGIAASSTLVFDENPSQTQYQIRDKIENYLGVPEYHVIEDPNNTYIDHIDCWAKYLDVDKILIRSVQSSHPQYDEIEEVVDYFENQTTGYNTSYEIYRVYTPQNQPYSNSIILNDKVLVPQTGSSWDDDALDVYEEAMPGYEIVGVTGSWESTDAMHCRAKGIADREMIFISHTPVNGDVEPTGEEGIEIEATLIPMDDENVSDLFAEIRYKYDNGIFQTSSLYWNNGNQFSGFIPACSGNCEVSYYIQSVNSSGNLYNHPFIGEYDPHVFNMINPEVQIPVNYSEDWNLVGNPVNTSDNLVFDLFPTSTENTLYSFGPNGYVPQSELEPGTGYWLHFQEDGMTSVSGLPIYEQSLTLNEGWNLISGISSTLSTTQISDPENILIPNTFYGYEPGSGYINSDEIIPGNGYWVRTNSEGIITLNGESFRTIQFNNLTHNADWISINGVKLFLDVSIPEEDRASYSLPPKPIGSGIDIRFKGDVVYCENKGIIEIQAEKEFLNMEYHISNSSNEWSLTDVSNGSVTTIMGMGQTIINNVPLLNIEKQTNLPEEFILYPNFPNPFNPTTLISFDLSNDKFISLDIFDISGQFVRNLEKGVNHAGYHSVEWNGKDSAGNNLPAGIYFYTLSFENKKYSHKMVLLK